jgi:lauroyl/myristoyl acyltransferase
MAVTDRTGARPSGYRGTGVPGRRVDRRPGAAGRVPPRRPDTRRQRLTGAVWLAAWQVARRLPEAVAFGIANVAARVAVWRGGAGGARLRANLARVVDPADLDAAVVDAHRSYARYWVEAFRAADIGEDDIARRVTTDGFEHLDAVLDEGRGAIVLLAHHGSWDIAARWAEVHGYHLAVVAEIVRPRRLFARFVELREAMGLEVVPLEPRARIGGRGIGARLGEVLADNHLVGLLTDRDLSGRAPLVDFFGAPCRIPIGATVLAKRNDAPIVPITMLQRPGRRWHLQVLEPRRVHDLEIHEAQRQVAAALEEIIGLDPTQWHAFQPIWPDPVPSDGA